MVSMDLTAEQMASVVHEANRQFRIILGQGPGPHWNEADPQMKASTINSVRRAMEGASPEELHEEWLEWRGSRGWTWGPTKDRRHKKHPCMVAYDQLPEHEKVKDHMFHALVTLMYGVSR